MAIPQEEQYVTVIGYDEPDYDGTCAECGEVLQRVEEGDSGWFSRENFHCPSCSYLYELSVIGYKAEEPTRKCLVCKKAEPVQVKVRARGVGEPSAHFCPECLVEYVVDEAGNITEVHFVRDSTIRRRLKAAIKKGTYEIAPPTD